MSEYNSFKETERILRAALSLSPTSVKDIAAATGIKAGTLYKWKSSQQVHLSPKKADTLLNYFKEKEPVALMLGEIVMTAYLLLLDYSAS